LLTTPADILLRSATGFFSPESQACLKVVSDLLFKDAARSQFILAATLQRVLSVSTPGLKCKP